MHEEGIAWYRAAAEMGFAKALEKLEQTGEPVDFSETTPDPAREPQRSEARLMTFDPTGFTIQLFSSSRPASAERFIVENGLTRLALRFRVPRDGALWTAVVYGWYPDPEEARTTVDNLKPALKGAGPWIRPVADVLAKILEARRIAEAPE